MKKLLLLTLLLVSFISFSGMSQSCTKTASTGDWNTSGTWSPAGVPVAGDVICIPVGVTVTIPSGISIDLSSANTIVNIYGTLNWGGSGNGNNTELLLSAGSALNFHIGATLIPGNNGSQIYLSIPPANYNKSGISNLTAGFSYPSGSPLPVELIKFNVINNAGLNSLSWQTASELNNEKFLIERSADGREYKIIGEVQGAGTTLEQRDYKFMDEQPLPGSNYYRLKQMDYDGSSSLSQVRLVEVLSDGGTTVFPTATTGEFTVQTTDDEIMEVNVFDLQGRLLEKINNDGAQSLSFELSGHASGTYLVVVHTEYGTTNHRIIRP